MLDGIHEDVNRVLRKPYVEKVEARGGEEDRVAAQRAWDAHLRRNDSFIVDTMHGQYKSVREVEKRRVFEMQGRARGFKNHYCMSTESCASDCFELLVALEEYL